MHRTFNYFYLGLGLLLAAAAVLWKLWPLLLLALPAIGLFFYRRRSR
jgi:hypothetical protein